ncbi:thiamine pyrophosphate-dependent enzyme [Kibdelosporangium persicum]|uniref:Phosphonopyruvate decarboxylase beta subunit n=1 Tax=Kibdelosporangium persicum TaxID=2698649 RepID=A0ABX2FHX1_9PSEU|nr:thiamine pyrophosphate-dependent enzyme [Kibdelosporangium persicum]NRN70990.1 Phosphonopyruvate decarboxylase beta subunit [Kibdelosporangium persicum]
MNKTDALRTIIATAPDQPIVFSTGYMCRIARMIADRATHFYMTGSMGLASSIGIGIAQQTNRPTVVVDGDGSALMNPVGLFTAGAQESLPLVHIVLDDGRYDSTGGQVVPNRPDFCALAWVCGYGRVYQVTDPECLAERLGTVLRSCTTTTFIRCVVSGPDSPVPARVDGDLGGHAQRFTAALAAQEGR